MTSFTKHLNFLNSLSLSLSLLTFTGLVSFISLISFKAQAFETTNVVETPGFVIAQGSTNITLSLEGADLSQDAKVCLNDSGQGTLVPIVLPYGRGLPSPSGPMNAGANGCNTANINNFIDCPSVPPHGSSTAAQQLFAEIEALIGQHPKFNETTNGNLTSSNQYVRYICRVGSALRSLYITYNQNRPYPPTASNQFFFVTSYNFENDGGVTGTGVYYVLICNGSLNPVVNSTCSSTGQIIMD